MMEIDAYIELSLGLVAAVWALFAVTHSVTKIEFNNNLAQRIQLFTLGPWLEELPKKVSILLDFLFTVKPLSVSFIFRSCVASITLYLVIYLLFHFASGEGVIDRFKLLSSKGSFSIWIFYSLLILGNLFPDYLSLLATRYLVRWLAEREVISIRLLLAIIAVDFIATVLIFSIAYSPIQYLFHSVRDGLHIEKLWHTLLENFSISIGYFTNPHIDTTTSVFFENFVQFITTFGTSIWIWLFGLSIILVNVGNKFGGKSWIYVRDSLLDIENKPLMALGWVISSCTLLFLILVSPFFVTFIK